MTITMKLSENPDAPFVFRIGERVAWRRADGSVHPEFRGAVVEGKGTFEIPGGARSACYWVERADGRVFGARELDLVRISEPDEA